MKQLRGLSFWLITVLVLSFSVLLYSGLRIFHERPPVPGRVLSSKGEVITTSEQIQAGQEVLIRNQLTDYGSVLGHGAYFGPDFTAEAIHVMSGSYATVLGGQEAVVTRFKTNGYRAADDVLPLDATQEGALQALQSYYRERIRTVWPKDGIHLKASDEEIRNMVYFIWWTAWASTTRRLDANHTYTNNWPYDAAAGNTVPADAILWSGISAAVLVLGVALLSLAYFRGNLYGKELAGDPEQLTRWEPTSSQRKTMKFFVLASLLFSLQVFLGAYLAHAYIEPEGFYGLSLTSLLPFNLARGLHLQLAIFWIALSFLGMGLFVAPIVGGREPRGQGFLVDVLFGAVVLVAVGSMIGEALTVWGLMPANLRLLGSDGWEYMELGYAWRVLLFGGLLIWAALVIRGVWPRLVKEKDRLGLVHLFAYATSALGLAYGASLLFDARTHVSIAEYWRFWVIHLWVEGTFEVFAVVVMGLMFVAMGLIEPRSLARALKFQILIILGSGVIGTGHHLYFTGSPSFMIGLSACFSALEVVPLCLLCVDAFDQYRTLKKHGQDSTYAPVFWCLISVGLWNMFGAGVLGFLINLPAVSYFQMGSWFTAAHGHGALMGVYGMLSIAMMLFCMRGAVTPKYWERLSEFRSSFWALNIGLLGMIVLVIVPIGYLQLQAAVESGFWFARTREFYQTSLVRGLLWFRILPDLLFIFGALRLTRFLVRALGHLRPVSVDVDPAQETIPRSFDVPEA